MINIVLKSITFASALVMASKISSQIPFLNRSSAVSGPLSFLEELDTQTILGTGARGSAFDEIHALNKFCLDKEYAIYFGNEYYPLTGRPADELAVKKFIHDHSFENQVKELENLAFHFDYRDFNLLEVRNLKSLLDLLMLSDRKVPVKYVFSGLDLQFLGRNITNLFPSDFKSIVILEIRNNVSLSELEFLASLLGSDHNLQRVVLASGRQYEREELGSLLDLFRSLAPLVAPVERVNKSWLSRIVSIRNTEWSLYLIFVLSLVFCKERKLGDIHVFLWLTIFIIQLVKLNLPK